MQRQKKSILSFLFFGEPAKTFVVLFCPVLQRKEKKELTFFVVAFFLLSFLSYSKQDKTTPRMF